MSVIGVAAGKGAPGVTTTVLALASAWAPDRALTVIDLDLGGGDIGGWLDLPATPNLSTLAADARRSLEPEDLRAAALPLPGRGTVGVLPGARSPEEAAVALELLDRARFGDVLQRASAVEDGMDVLIDLGRVDDPSSVSSVLASLDLLLLVLRPTWPQVHHVGTRLPGLRSRAPVGLVLIGEAPYGAGEVAGALGAEVTGVLADDGAAAGTFDGSVRRVRGLERSRLWRTAAVLADRLRAVQPAQGSTVPC